MTYKQYLASDHWREKKHFYFQTHEKKCRACSSRSRIHLHHKTYRRLGEERDADLVPLCHLCHAALHRKQRKDGQNLWLATEEFIRLKKKKYKRRNLVKRQSSRKKLASKR